MDSLGSAVHAQEMAMDAPGDACATGAAPIGFCGGLVGLGLCPAQHRTALMRYHSPGLGTGHAMSLRLGPESRATIDPARGKRGETPSHTPGLGYPPPSHLHAHTHTHTHRHTQTHTHTPCQFMVLAGGTGALRKAVSGVPALDPNQLQSCCCNSHSCPVGVIWAVVHSPRRDATLRGRRSGPSHRTAP